MPLVEFYDKKAYHCSEHLFQRMTEDGVLEYCHMNIDTGALTWHARTK